MRAAVVGCGAVGAAISVALARGGAEVHVITREARGCSQGVVAVEGIGEARLRVCGWGEAPRDVDVLVLATKAYDVEGAVQGALTAGLRPRLAVSVQNGLGPLETVERAFPSTAGMLLYLGLTRAGDCKAVHTGGSRVVLGCRRPCDLSALSELAGLLGSSGLRAEVVGPAEFEGERWLKLAVNSAVNPLTLIKWSRNGAVLTDPLLREAAAALAAETGRVAEGLGVRLPRDPVEETFRTARETSENCSSTVQDVALGRRTELEYINKAVWERSLGLSFRAALNLLAYEAGEAASAWLRGRRSPCVG